MMIYIIEIGTTTIVRVGAHTDGTVAPVNGAEEDSQMRDK